MKLSILQVQLCRAAYRCFLYYPVLDRRAMWANTSWSFGICHSHPMPTEAITTLPHMLCFPVSLMGLLHFRNTFSTHADALNQKFFFIPSMSQGLCRGPLPIDIVTHTLVSVDSRHSPFRHIIEPQPLPAKPRFGLIPSVRFVLFVVYAESHLQDETVPPRTQVATTTCQTPESITSTQVRIMVGVPGKYKGCETCRRRRVKCSNERPYCHKCIAGGKECEGYQRERVFITGTPQNKGRVASHPKKGSSSKKKRSPSSKEPPRALDLTPTQPLTSAWDSHTLVSNHGAEYSILVSALNARLPYPLPNDSALDEPSSPFQITFPPYTPTEIQPLIGGGDLNVRAQCLARIPSVHDQDDSAQSYCVFFFEHEAAYAFDESGSNRVRRLVSPNTHVNSVVLSVFNTGFALLNRQDTFISSQDWRTIPWQSHPKSLLDSLLDYVLFLPAILAQVDRITPVEATLSRRYHAQQLLRNCLSLEKQFNAWFQVATRSSYGYPMAYWVDEFSNPSGLLPFSNLYTFKDGNTGLAFLYYWMTQIIFHRCIENLHRIIYQPAIDAYPDMWPNLPYDLQVDITQYKHGCLFAADICRGLDSVLHETDQPDMLILPMKVAMDFYKDIHATSQDGLMEIMWIENFRSRLAEKGQHVAGVLQSQKWSEVATF
ncbi:unnamed protein product [Fusarium graminearum]|nr:unnamed protein product [Fusarium graminearum]